MAIGIISTGVCIGEIVHTNEDLNAETTNYDSSKSPESIDSWIKEKFGIEKRARSQKLTSDLAAEACKQAIANADISIEQIDFLILNTASGDYKQPTTATEVQRKIGMKANSFALEINMPCAGSIYGIAVAQGFIKSGMGQFGLVVGADRMSSIIDSEDFIMSGMFGDAGGACLVGTNPTLAIDTIFLKSKADIENALSMKSSGSAFPLNEKHLRERNHFLQMKGKATSQFIRESLTESINFLLTESKLKINELDQIIVHQASKPIVESTLLARGLKKEQFSFTVHKYGNTSSASILLTLHEYLQGNGPRNEVFLVGMGSGLNWGGISLSANNI